MESLVECLGEHSGSQKNWQGRDALMQQLEDREAI